MGLFSSTRSASREARAYPCSKAEAISNQCTLSLVDASKFLNVK